MLRSIANQVNKRYKAFSLYSNKLGAFGTLMYMIKRATTPKGELICIKVKNGGKLYVRNKFYDTVIFSQIFIYEDLNFYLPGTPTTIIDCGANIGLSTLYFKFKYPDVRIISIEPESSNFELLQKNTSGFQGISLLKKGIWNKTCQLYLIDTGDGHASFQVSETTQQKKVIDTIDAIGIGDLFKTYNIANADLLKMDIEGSEYNCFDTDDTAWVDHTNCIAVEIHDHIVPGSKALIDDRLEDRHYELVGEYHIYSKTSKIA